jgi:hypothetical protein
MSKWEPKLKKWDDLMDRLEFEKVVVEDAPTDRVESTMRAGKESLFLPESQLKQRGGKKQPEMKLFVGGTHAGSSSSSQRGQSGTSDGEDSELDGDDSGEKIASEEENEPVGVVESDYRPSCKQVAEHLESQSREAAQRKSGDAHRKHDTSTGSSRKVSIVTKDVGLTNIQVSQKN